MQRRIIIVSLLFIAALLVATVSVLGAASNKQRATVLSCSFPDSFLAFSVFRYSPATNTTTQVSPETTDGMSFNAQFTEQHGLTYSTDISGSINIVSSRTPSARVASGAAMNDHARWCPVRKRLLFVSTRDRNPNDNQGWNAVFAVTYDKNTNSLSAPVRLTPRGETDYSPAWGPHTTQGQQQEEALVAVASGSGAPGGTGIVLMAITENGTVTRRWTAVKNGGWPTWLSSTTLLFHRNTGHTVDEWSVFAYNIETQQEFLLLENAMTPSVSDSINQNSGGKVIAFAYIEQDTGFRQIATFDMATDSLTLITAGVKNHHYSPFRDARTGDVYFHKCRGSTMPNLRRRTSPDPTLDIATVSGDFPSLSPDGKLVSVIYANFASFLRVDLFDSDGRNRRTLYNKTHCWMTSWVNQSRIAFTRGPAFSTADDASVQVAEVEVLTGKERVVTHSTNANQGYPCYSPDGSRIVFRTSQVNKKHDHATTTTESPNAMPGPYHLAIINASANGHSSNDVAIDLTHHNAGDDVVIGDQHPHWGPDYVVFASDRGHPGRMSIWKIAVVAQQQPDASATTTTMFEIFDHGAHSVHPTVTPDGRIVFTSTVSEYSMEEIAWPYTFFPRAELFVMDADGSNWHRLTHDPSNQANAWTGPQQLPETLSTDGPPCSCRYRDSTDPAPAAPAPPKVHDSEDSEDNKKKRGASSCPFARLFFAAHDVIDDADLPPGHHAVLRKHGVAGVMTSPEKRKQKKRTQKVIKENLKLIN